MIVAATFAGAAATNSAASRVVTCSSTILSAGKSRTMRVRMPLDEDALAIEHVDVGIGDFAVQRQHEAVLLHRRERRLRPLDRRDAGVRVGRRARPDSISTACTKPERFAAAISAALVLSVR